MPMPSGSSNANSSADRIRSLIGSQQPDMSQYVQAPMSEPPLQMPQQPQELNKTYRIPASMMPNQSPQEIAFWKAAKGF
jgi:hypothetical protein